MSDMGALGRTYQDGEVVCRQGEVGDCLYVIQEGQLEVIVNDGGTPSVVAVVGKDELIGEMAIFEHETRSATVRARGTVRVLTLDKRNFLRRINEDPSLAFRIIETMSRRVRRLTKELAGYKNRSSGDGADS